MNAIVEVFRGRGGGTVFVDDLGLPVVAELCLPESCRLFTLPGFLPDLHEFAGALDLKLCWFHEHADLPHYDLTPQRRELALRRGAVEVSPEELVDAEHNWLAHQANWRREVLERMAAGDLHGDGRRAAGLRSMDGITAEEVSAWCAQAREKLFDGKGRRR